MEPVQWLKTWRVFWIPPTTRQPSAAQEVLLAKATSCVAQQCVSR
jgi:hypothetical protein